MPKIVKYKAHPTLRRFHKSDAFVRGIRGAIGSGKSVACCWEIFRRMQEQHKDVDGIRKSRWVVVRNTYRELMDTTVKTWMDWFGSTGIFNNHNMTHFVKYNDVEAEVMFRALDRPKDVKKLLSLELTGAWVNEAREVPKTIIDMLQGRVGRYPSIRDGGCKWFGIIMDTNPPDTDHWWYKMFEEIKPENWEQFVQPSGLSPDAENLENLPPNYYKNLIAGKSVEWIKVYVHGEYGMSADGKPVYPEYVDSLHVAMKDNEAIPNVNITLGFDFGLTPACVIGQLTPKGQLLVLDELVVDGHGSMGIRQFVREVVKPFLLKNYKDWYDKKLIYSYGDPAGNQKSQTDETTCMMILAEEGIVTSGAYTNDFIPRRESVARFLTEQVDERPRFLLNPRCQILRKGFNGGYKYERVQVTGDERYKNVPSKNKYSHPHDALQYLAMMVRSELMGDKEVLSYVDRRLNNLEKGNVDGMVQEFIIHHNSFYRSLKDELSFLYGYADEDDDTLNKDLRRTI